jgi:hypothetical protein
MEFLDSTFRNFGSFARAFQWYQNAKVLSLGIEEIGKECFPPLNPKPTELPECPRGCSLLSYMIDSKFKSENQCVGK